MTNIIIIVAIVLGTLETQITQDGIQIRTVISVCVAINIAYHSYADWLKSPDI